MFDFKSGGKTSVFILEHTLPQCLDLSLVQAYTCCAGALFAECLIPQVAPLSTVISTACVCACSALLCNGHTADMLSMMQAQLHGAVAVTITAALAGDGGSCG